MGIQTEHSTTTEAETEHFFYKKESFLY